MMIFFIHFNFFCCTAQIYPIKCNGYEPTIQFLEEECLSLSFPFSALNYNDGNLWVEQSKYTEYCDEIQDEQCKIQFNGQYHLVKQMQVLPSDIYGKKQQETFFYVEFDENKYFDDLKCHGYISLTPNQYLPNQLFDNNLNICLEETNGFLTKESIFLPQQYLTISFEKDKPNYIIKSNKLFINRQSFEISQFKTILDSSDFLQFPEEIFREITKTFTNLGFQIQNGYLMISSTIKINGNLPIIIIEIEGEQLKILPYNYFKVNYNNWGYDYIMIQSSNNMFFQNQVVLGKPFLVYKMINFDLKNHLIKLVDNISCVNYLQLIKYQREKYWLILSLTLFFIMSYILYRKSMKLELIKQQTHMELSEI